MQSSYSLTSRGYVFTEEHMEFFLILGYSIYDFEQRIKGGQGFTFWAVLFNVSGNRYGLVTSLTDG